MDRFAVAGVLVAAACCAGTAVRAAPLDNAIQSLSDVAFVSGRAPATGAVILRPADPARPELPDMAIAMARPLQAPHDGGVSLGGQVPVHTVGAFLQGKLRDLGVKDGSAAYGGRSRFYLFAAVHGQAVGMNLVSGSGGLHRDGWSSDASSALVGDGQVGFGWRKGGMEADLGYVHRGVHVRNAPRGAADSYADDMAAVSFTFRPNW